MRIALYVENDFEQVTLTPETETERRILEKMHDGSRIVAIRKGAFYHCQGGWVRERDPLAADATLIVMQAPERMKEDA